MMATKWPDTMVHCPVCLSATKKNWSIVGICTSLSALMAKSFWDILFGGNLWNIKKSSRCKWNKCVSWLRKQITIPIRRPIIPMIHFFFRIPFCRTTAAPLWWPCLQTSDAAPWWIFQYSGCRSLKTTWRKRLWCWEILGQSYVFFEAMASGQHKVALLTIYNTPSIYFGILIVSWSNK